MTGVITSALEAEDETVDLEATSSLAGSSSLTGSSAIVVSANFEISILTILVEISAGQNALAGKT